MRGRSRLASEFVFIRTCYFVPCAAAALEERGEGVAGDGEVKLDVLGQLDLRSKK